jgi:hypothetical protein
MACVGDTVSLCGGARAGVRLGIGSSSGAWLFQTRTSVAASPSLGPALHAALQAGPVRLALDVTGLVNPGTSELGVDGLPTVITTPRFELLVHLTVGARTR